MADIAASDVTYTKRGSRDELTGSSKYRAVFDVAFGDGALTYPSGGVPLTKGNMGMPVVIKAFNMVDKASDNGNEYKYDESAETIRIFVSGTELSAGVATPAATTLVVEVTGY